MRISDIHLDHSTFKASKSETKDFTGWHLPSNLLQSWQWKHNRSVLTLARAAAYHRVPFICSPVSLRFVLE